MTDERLTPQPLQDLRPPLPDLSLEGAPKVIIDHACHGASDVHCLIDALDHVLGQMMDGEAPTAQFQTGIQTLRAIEDHFRDQIVYRSITPIPPRVSSVDDAAHTHVITEKVMGALTHLPRRYADNFKTFKYMLQFVHEFSSAEKLATQEGNLVTVGLTSPEVRKHLNYSRLTRGHNSLGNAIHNSSADTFLDKNRLAIHQGALNSIAEFNRGQVSSKIDILTAVHGGISFGMLSRQKDPQRFIDMAFKYMQALPSDNLLWSRLREMFFIGPRDLATIAYDLEVANPAYTHNIFELHRYVADHFWYPLVTGKSTDEAAEARLQALFATDDYFLAQQLGITVLTGFAHGPFWAQKFTGNPDAVRNSYRSVAHVYEMEVGEPSSHIQMMIDYMVAHRNQFIHGIRARFPQNQFLETFMKQLEPRLPTASYRADFTSLFANYIENRVGEKMWQRLNIPERLQSSFDELHASLEVQELDVTESIGERPVTVSFGRQAPISVFGLDTMTFTPSQDPDISYHFHFQPADLPVIFNGVITKNGTISCPSLREDHEQAALMQKVIDMVVRVGFKAAIEGKGVVEMPEVIVREEETASDEQRKHQTGLTATQADKLLRGYLEE